MWLHSLMTGLSLATEAPSFSTDLLQSRPTPLSNHLPSEGQRWGCIQVRVCVWFTFCYKGSDSGTEWTPRPSFSPCSYSTTWACEEWRTKEILLGLGDAEAAERALQLLVVDRRDGKGRVALHSRGILLIPLPPVAPTALADALSAVAAQVWGWTVMNRGRRKAKQGGWVLTAATDRWRGVGHAAVPGRLAEGVLELVLPRGRGAAARGSAHWPGHRSTQ